MKEVTKNKNEVIQIRIKVYAILLDGELYKGYTYKKRKSFYEEEKSAKSVVTADSYHYAKQMYNGDKYYFEDKSKDIKNSWIEKARKRFEIVELVWER